MAYGGGAGLAAFSPRLITTPGKGAVLVLLGQPQSVHSHVKVCVWGGMKLESSLSASQGFSLWLWAEWAGLSSLQGRRG